MVEHILVKIVQCRTGFDQAANSQQKWPPYNGITNYGYFGGHMQIFQLKGLLFCCYVCLFAKLIFIEGIFLRKLIYKE